MLRLFLCLAHGGEGDIYKKTETDLSSEKGLTPEKKALFKRESEFAKQHNHDTDEEIFEYLRFVARKLGKPPTKQEVVGYYYIKSRFGPWPRVLEKAGLKEVSKKQLTKQEKRAAARKSNKKKQCKIESELNTRSEIKKE